MGWEHIAVRPGNKKRFEYLKSYLISPQRTRITQDELLETMMDLFEKHKIPEIIANVKKK